MSDPVRPRPDLIAALREALGAWQAFDAEAADQNPCPDLTLRHQHRLRARALTESALRADADAKLLTVSDLQAMVRDVTERAPLSPEALTELRADADAPLLNNWREQDRALQEIWGALGIDQSAPPSPADIARHVQEQLRGGADADARPPQEGVLHPVRQVYFRAGLLACREYMARFVAAESPSIAMSIRANWWPSLGQDFGPPRKLRWDEVANGEFGTPDFRVKTADEVSPTQEALPVALEFLDLPVEAAAVPRRAAPPLVDPRVCTCPDGHGPMVYHPGDGSPGGEYWECATCRMQCMWPDAPTEPAGRAEPLKET